MDSMRRKRVWFSFDH